jgi:hypothetical protein
LNSLKFNDTHHPTSQKICLHTFTEIFENHKHHCTANEEGAAVFQLSLGNNNHKIYTLRLLSTEASIQTFRLASTMNIIPWDEAGESNGACGDDRFGPSK